MELATGLIKITAEAVYNYMGSEELPPFDSLAPTVQISYIEEAESCLITIADYARFLSTRVPVEADEQAKEIIEMTLKGFADHIDPTVHRHKKGL